MAKRQPLRQRPDRGFLSLRQSADGQEQQVLLRLEARLQRRGVAFLQEPPYAVAQLRQRPVFPVCNPCSHSFILSHHDICFQPPHFPVVVASSDGRRNTFLKFTRRSLESQGLSWTLIQAQRDLVELRLRVGRQVSSLGEVLP